MGGSYVTDMENVLISPKNSVSPYERFYGSKSPYTENVHEFGEIGVVERHTEQKMRQKSKNSRKPCIYVGKFPNHTQEVYKF